MKRLFVYVIAILSVYVSPLSADETIGVVLMHGKAGTSSPSSPTGVLSEHLEGSGLLVVAPDMPWSEERVLDQSYEDAMQEIDTIVQGLRDKGATRIVVGGHSMGATTARLKSGTPLLWNIGGRDRMFDRSEDYAFSRAPAHTSNAYVVVKGGHRVTPKKGKDEILEWINNL